MDRRNNFTKRLLVQAGIKKGMRVLDVGCGGGEVTTVIREQVGECGQIIGIDLNERLLKMAEENHYYSNVSYQKLDVYQLPATLGMFDMIVGRRILMYLPDSIEALRQLKRRLQPGGIIVFQESDSVAGGVGAEQLPLHQKALENIWKTVQSEGGNIHIGTQLYSRFIEAGFIRDMQFGVWSRM